MLLCGLLICTPLNSAGIYKWVDADGTVHYGEHPPDKGARELSIRHRAQTGDDSKTAVKPNRHDPRAQRDKIIQSMEAERLARQEKKRKDKQDSQKVKMDCARARDDLRQYSSAGSLYKLNPDGTRQTLSDASRQQAIMRLKNEIKKRCK